MATLAEVEAIRDKGVIASELDTARKAVRGSVSSWCDAVQEYEKARAKLTEPEDIAHAAARFEQAASEAAAFISALPEAARKQMDAFFGLLGYTKN